MLRRPAFTFHKALPSDESLKRESAFWPINLLPAILTVFDVRPGSCVSSGRPALFRVQFDLDTTFGSRVGLNRHSAQDQPALRLAASQLPCVGGINPDFLDGDPGICALVG